MSQGDPLLTDRAAKRLWPETMRRLMAAEDRVKELEAQVITLRTAMEHVASFAEETLRWKGE